MRKLKLASYQTERGAAKYAADLVKVHPANTAAVVPTYDFKYGVRVTMPDGRSAMAARRPAGFGKVAP